MYKRQALEYVQLKELLTPEEYAAARSSTLNAHYTSPTVIQAIYEAVDRMGFETGNILEPVSYTHLVKKGEHGITIIAPTPYKKKIEEQKLDPDTKAPILDKDGKIVTEEKENAFSYAFQVQRMILQQFL